MIMGESCVTAAQFAVQLRGYFLMSRLHIGQIRISDITDTPTFNCDNWNLFVQRCLRGEDHCNFAKVDRVIVRGLFLIHIGTWAFSYAIEAIAALSFGPSVWDGSGSGVDKRAERRTGVPSFSLSSTFPSTAAPLPYSWPPLCPPYGMALVKI